MLIGLRSEQVRYQNHVEPKHIWISPTVDPEGNFFLPEDKKMIDPRDRRKSPDDPVTCLAAQQPHDDTIFVQICV